MKKLIYVCALLTLSTLATEAAAYLPRFRLILSRTADNHGRGLYSLEQDVSFGTGEGSFLVHERWIVENENRMQLEVEGRNELKDKIRLTYVYDGNRRFFIDSSGVKRSGAIGQEWIEPFFHFRNSKNMRPLLNSLKIIPASALQVSRQKIKKLEDFIPPDEPFVRLGRVGGFISYVIGAFASQATLPNPALWIEQDSFVVRKVRFPSQTVVSADKYFKFSNDLWFPRSRSVHWNDQQALITLLDVKSVSVSPEIKKKLNPQALEYGKSQAQGSVFPENSVIKDFYLRFR